MKRLFALLICIVMSFASVPAMADMQMIGYKELDLSHYVPGTQVTRYFAPGQVITIDTPKEGPYTLTNVIAETYSADEDFTRRMAFKGAVITLPQNVIGFRIEFYNQHEYRMEEIFPDGTTETPKTVTAGTTYSLKPGPYYIYDGKGRAKFVDVVDEDHEEYYGLCTPEEVLTDPEKYEPIYADVAPVQPDPRQPVKANMYMAHILLNHFSMSFHAYNINDYNYFKLRDIALVFSGWQPSDTPFEVNWDAVNNAVTLIPGQVYTPVGGECDGFNVEKNEWDSSPITYEILHTPHDAYPVDLPVYVNGTLHMVEAYNIDGYNYVKLRDVAKLINFHVEWRQSEQAIFFDDNRPYSE